MPPRRGHKRANSVKSSPSLASKRAKRTLPSPKISAKPKNSGKSVRNDEERSHDLSFSEADTSQSSAYEGDESTESESSGPEEEEESEEESSVKRRKSGGKMPKKSSNRIVPRAMELLKPGVTTGLGPGTQVVIKKPKARTAGRTPYRDDTIHPNTFLFLGDLAANNNRDWLKANDPDYRTALKDFNVFIDELSPKVTETDETVPELPLKDLLQRFYRDCRFSSDKTPYRTSFAAAWSRTGRKGPYAKYYFQIKPGGSLIAGGLWMPEAAQIAALRTAVDQRSSRLKDVLKDTDIRKEFFGGVAADDKKVVKKFLDQNKENALKTKPKGYDADHKDVDLLRLRNYTLHRNLSDDEVLGPHGIDRVAELIRILVPFITYLNSVVMPDETDNDEENDSEDDETGSEVEVK